MRRGEVYEYSLPYPPERVRVVVLSTDPYLEDPRSRPTCVDIVRRIAGVTSPLLVPLVDPDPVGGVVDVTSIRPCSRDRLTGPIGMLTGGSMARVTEALAAYLEI